MKKYQWILIISILFILTYSFLSAFYEFTYRFFAVNETYDEAKRFWVIEKFIPPQAKNINYRIGVRKSNLAANFKIDEKDFIDWANKQHWQLKPINEPGSGKLIFDHSASDTVHIDIESGYYYNSEDYLALSEQGGHRMVIEFSYDKDKGIGYILRAGK